MTFNPLLPLPPAPRRGRCRNPAGFRQDYGGACRIRVELAGLGGAPPVVRDFKVPRDDDGDGIADAWELEQFAEWNATHGTNVAPCLEFFGGTPDRQEPRDPDGDGPLGPHASEGDGLGNSGEYRGFALPPHPLKAQPVHFRLSPARKDILVEMHVARGGGTNATGAAMAAQSMEAAAVAFRDSLGIGLHWYVGGLDFAVEVDPESYSNTVDRAAVRLRDTSPFQAERSHARCVVFGGNVFPSNAGLYGTTYQHSTVLVGSANIAGTWNGTQPGGRLYHFFRRNGISMQQFFDMVVTHELGHTVQAGKDGEVDELVPTADPVLTVLAKPEHDYAYDLEWMLREGAAPKSFLTAWAGRVPPYDPFTYTNAFWTVVLGSAADEAPTVSELAAQINAHGGYVATFPASRAGTPAYRLERGKHGIPRAGGGLGIKAEASVNGIMTYNLTVPERYTAPRFHNGAGPGSPPDAALLSPESATVRVLGPSR